MHLKVLLPSRILVDTEVAGITAESPRGEFCLLPRHIDWVAPLVPGILTYIQADQQETHLAVDHGILVKCKDRVLVSVRNGSIGPELGTLRQTVDREFAVLDEKERKARQAVAKLESGFIRQFLRIET
ncbi:MAG TPA: F0F1 ATP synthase subunit epsilon [Desulfomicrobiaceae bacterium]|nr:F0F1 ATP synthase subunit epsilon [Desulfomicrobiaceae bacterium]